MRNLFLLFMSLCCLGTASGEVDRLVLGFDDYPPFTGRDGSPRIAVDLLDTAMRRLGKNVDMIMVDSGDFEQIFTDERIQACPAIWYTRERKKEWVFSEPIFQNRLVLVGRKGSGASNLTLEDLKGKSVAVVDGYAYGPEVGGTDTEWVVGQSDEDNMVKVLNGTVDFALMEQMLLTYAKRVQREKFEVFLEIGSEPLVRKNLHFAVKKSVRGAKKLVKRLDQEMKQMLKDGTYHRILGVSELVTDVDGDGKLETVILGDPAETINPEEVFADFSDSPKPTQSVRWYLSRGKLYATQEEIPEAEREKAPQPTASQQFVFSGL